MDNVYGMVVGSILVLPWFVTVVMAVGAVWNKVRASGRCRASCQERTPSLRSRHTGSAPPV